MQHLCKLYKFVGEDPRVGEEIIHGCAISCFQAAEHPEQRIFSSDAARRWEMVDSLEILDIVVALAEPRSPSQIEEWRASRLCDPAHFDEHISHDGRPRVCHLEDEWLLLVLWLSGGFEHWL